jgi:signal transduction histidine kinase
VDGVTEGLAQEREAELTRLLDEQAALARVATLVAAGADPDEVFTTVIVEASRLVGLPHIDLTRYEGATGVIIAASGDHPFPVGSRWELDGPSVMATIARTGRPARFDDYRALAGEIARVARDAGFESAIGAPIKIDGRLWGAIIALSTDPEPISEQSEWRLTRFTDLVATAVANAESKSQLTASRRRIVTAADEARRRIERNLHDGVQQRLVALRFDLQRMREILEEEREALLVQVEQALEETLEDLREVSHGLHPPLLSRSGLGPSLQALARRLPIPVHLKVDLPERPEASLETAVYYAVSEAITNAIKHAQASEISVTVTSGEKLEVSIVDDGVGGADANGSGLTGLRDRIEALGGRFTLASPTAGGTTVSIELPGQRTPAGG